MDVESQLISVIVAVKNGERYLSQALRDVAAQTYSPVETIVVDGRSSDRSAEIARSFAGVKVITQDGAGFADAWNIGLRHARGELIAFLDSDDRWVPDKLEAQARLLARNPDLQWVISLARFFIEPGVTTPTSFRGSLLERAHVANMPSALLARRGVFDAIGTFPTDYEIANDIEWFARLKDAGLRRGVVRRVLICKRVHDANVSYNAPAAYSGELLRLLRDSLARQREASAER